MERVNMFGQTDLATKANSIKESGMAKEVGNQPK